MGLRSGGFGKPKMFEKPGDKPEVKKPGMPDGKHIHVHSHGGKISSHSTDEHGMEQENQHDSSEDAADHVRNFLNEGEQESSSTDNEPQPPTHGHFGLMA